VLSKKFTNKHKKILQLSFIHNLALFSTNHTVSLLVACGVPNLKFTLQLIQSRITGKGLNDKTSLHTGVLLSISTRMGNRKHEAQRDSNSLNLSKKTFGTLGSLL